MPARFYCTPELFPQAVNQEFIVVDAMFQHLKVRRIRVGERVILFDGKGNEASGMIESLAARQATLNIDEICQKDRESPLSISLMLPLIASDKMDFSIQKAVELGISEIYPWIASRSQGIPKAAWEKRYEHWQKIIISACEQCGRNTLPILHPLSDSRELLQRFSSQENKGKEPIKGIASFDGISLSKWLEGKEGNVSSVMAVGPEGGFTEDEVKLFSERGFQNINLGARVLRTETAVVKTLSVLQTLLGDG